MITSQHTLNPIQLHRKVQTEADHMWDDGTLDGQAIERILNEHWRTPYKEA